MTRLGPWAALRRIVRSGITAALAIAAGCSGTRSDAVHIEFWGLGREGEVVAEMIPDFERRNPGIRVDVQQLPWTAAHEKFLTAHVGESLPDVAQMGNTWVPEFHLVQSLEDLTPWVARSPVVVKDDYFGGIWETNVIGSSVYGVPWYVDTRVLFYRSDLLQAAGFDAPPRTWSEWMEVCRRLKEKSGRPDFYPILLPTNEWPPPVVMAVQKGAPFVSDDARAIFDRRFVSALEYYLSFFRHGYAPVASNAQIANLYQQFAEGEFAMFITGPWNIGELRRRLPEAMQTKWATAPMPTPDGQPYPGLSLAGGSSLVLFKQSKQKEAAWKLIEYLSEPAQQVRVYEKSGDLPPRKSAWNAEVLARDEKAAAFRAQLERTVALPRIPEWERIATMIFEQGELAARGQFNERPAAE
ncbi:MAG TPA: sugar ABC transporter substrate-binding protein, partial [Thermoanaerobaculia bacterium]|nr:sugar ABC transporter substrate-binding protein [Thermoanaerobaculia bacterium]